MIVRNELFPSAFIVFTFWYIATFVAAILLGAVDPIWFPMDYAATLVAILIGVGAAVFCTFGVHAVRMHRRELSILKGDARLGATLTLGSLPPEDAPERGRRKDVEAALHALHARRWWPMVRDEFAPHAAAAEAIVSAMALEPLLPASPVPGGHGDRTLLEHSLGVADVMVHHARAWRYTGQKDRSGVIRVPVEHPSGAHAFKRPDVGLVALCGLAHDIGKLVCYAPTSRDTDGHRTLPVHEVRPKHDTEGAALLRRIPEVMALPYKDRFALLTACGYYHHAGELPLGGVLTDRERSLTELLIVADNETGRIEGGPAVTGSPQARRARKAPARAAAQAPMAKPVKAAPVAPKRPAVASAAPVAPAPAPAKPERKGGMALSRTMQLFLQSFASPSAVGLHVRDPQRRVGFKCGDDLLVSASLLRSNLNRMELTPDESLEMLAPGEDSEGIFTIKLLHELDGAGLLKRDFEGHTLPVERALYVVDIQGMHSAVDRVFITRSALVPSLRGAPDTPYTIVHPQWGGPKKGARPAVKHSKPVDENTGAAAVARVAAALHEAYPELKVTKTSAGDMYLAVPSGTEAGSAVQDMLRRFEATHDAAGVKRVIKVDGGYMVPMAS
ncbi:MAG TPA: HD domain-containing protein [Nevskiaceae bacterium]|nr:HD domain-containing protein [Nevskiaceae bacterium]